MLVTDFSVFLSERNLPCLEKTCLANQCICSGNRIHVSADTKVLLAESKKQFILERKGITALKVR